MEIYLFIKGKLLKDQIFKFVFLVIKTSLNSRIKYLDCAFTASNSYGLKPGISFRYSNQPINYIKPNFLWKTT